MTPRRASRRIHCSEEEDAETQRREKSAFVCIRNNQSNVAKGEASGSWAFTPSLQGAFESKQGKDSSASGSRTRGDARREAAHRQQRRVDPAQVEGEKQNSRDLEKEAKREGRLETGPPENTRERVP